MLKKIVCLTSLLVALLAASPARAFFATNTWNTWQPPDLSTLDTFYWSQNLDGARNTTLTVGSPLTSGQVRNLGPRGGTYTCPGGTCPTLRQNAAGIYSVDHHGADTRLQQTFGVPLTQPNTILYCGLTATAGSQVYYDGLIGARHSVSSLGTSALAIGTVGGGNFSYGVAPITGNYDCFFAYFNTTSSIIAPDWVGPKSSSDATGNVGIASMGGLTIGANYDGSGPATGTDYLLAIWHGSPAPSEQQAWDMVTHLLQNGWPTTSLVQDNSVATPNPLKVLIHASDSVYVIGDSITAGNPGPEPWQTPFVASVNAFLSPPATFTNKGSAGDTCSQMQARFASNVIANNPNVCILQCGINDVLPSNVASTTAAITSMVNAWTGAGHPLNKFLLLGAMVIDERLPEPMNAEVYKVTNAQSALAAQLGIAYADERAAQQAYDMVNNTPAPGNMNNPGPTTQKLITTDGRHPTSSVTSYSNGLGIGTGVWSTTAFNVTTLSN